MSEQILIAIPLKTEAHYPLMSPFINDLSKSNKTGWALLEKHS